MQVAGAALHMLASGELNVDLPRAGLYMQRLGVVQVHSHTCRWGGLAGQGLGFKVLVM